MNERETIRIDKWLWQARFFKTRGLAASIAESGHVRVDGRAIDKPGYTIAPGHRLTFPQGRVVRVVRVLGCGVRRGPPAEARLLYEDLDQAPAGKDQGDV